MISSKKPATTDIEAVIEIMQCFYKFLPSQARGEILVCIQNKIAQEDETVSDKGKVLKRVASKIIDPKVLDF